MAGLSYLRFAAGVCVLTAGLLIGGVGGAVAVADPDAIGSTTHGDNGTNDSGKQTSTGAKKPKKPKNEPGDTDTNGGTRASGGHSGQQPSPGAEKAKHEPDGTDSTDETNDSASSPWFQTLVRCAGFPMWSRRTLVWWRRSLMWSPQFRTW